MDKAEISERLDELGIEHDGRLGKKALIKLLPEDERPEEGTITCVIQRAYWPEEGRRVDAGAEIEVTLEDAMDGVESGFLARKK